MTSIVYLLGAVAAYALLTWIIVVLLRSILKPSEHHDVAREANIGIGLVVAGHLSVPIWIGNIMRPIAWKFSREILALIWLIQLVYVPPIIIAAAIEKRGNVVAGALGTAGITVLLAGATCALMCAKG